MTVCFTRRFMFDKRASPVLSRSEITKYGKPKPGGGRGGGRGRRGVISLCGASDASGHVDEPDEFGDAEPLASMPGGSDIGPIP